MWSPSGIDPGAAADMLARAAAVLLVAALVGRAFHRMRLPRISGYLLTGAALGPRALAVLRETHAARLAATDSMCLAVIGIAAGAELQMAELRRHPRPTLVMTACVSIFSFGFVFLAFLVVGPRVAFLSALGAEHVAMVGSLLGTLAIARSPASAIAVLREMDGKGPFCQHVMAVTVAKDALVVALFALNVEFAALADLDFSPGAATANERFREVAGDGSPHKTPLAAVLRALCLPLVSVAAACFLGAALGAATSRACVSRPRFLFFAADREKTGEAKEAPTRRGSASLLAKRALRAAAVALASGAAFALASRARVEPLLLCVAAGATCANGRHAGGADARETLRLATETLMPVVNLLFFTAAGSSARFDRVFADANAALAAIVLFAARLFALFHAAAHARDALATTSATPSFFRDPAVAEKIWLAMITQAGVAMGLVKSCERRFASSWGGDFAALAAATVALNLLAGPPAFRHAVFAAGESGAQRAGSGGKGEPVTIDETGGGEGDAGV